MDFSVLMAVYYKENPIYLDRALQSVWDDQTIKPSEIVLVEDGYLNNELYDVLDKWQMKLGKIFKIVKLKENLGLGSALNIGLQYCNNELVARMDSDDISDPYRFEKQLEVFKTKTIDVCGTWVSEFIDDENQIISIRTVPETHEQILKFAKKRCPVNHPSVMFKKSSILKAGGYKKIFPEDYHLWVRMLVNGSIFYNIQEPLVKMRIGAGLFSRRRGIKYAINELKLQREFVRLGFINYIEFIENVILKFPLRLIPESILKQVYRMFLR